MFTLINVFSLSVHSVCNALYMVDLFHYQLSPTISLCEQFSLICSIFDLTSCIACIIMGYSLFCLNLYITVFSHSIFFFLFSHHFLNVEVRLFILLTLFNQYLVNECTTNKSIQKKYLHVEKTEICRDYIIKLLCNVACINITEIF